MPYSVVKRKGKRPYKIVEKIGSHTKTVGSSTSRKNAESSIRARYRAER